MCVRRVLSSINSYPCVNALTGAWRACSALACVCVYTDAPFLYIYAYIKKLTRTFCVPVKHAEREN